MLFAVLVLSSTSCTVAPKRVTISQPSFDGNVQNSGFVSQMPDKSWIVTPHWRDRYNDMIDTYGVKWHLKHDDGMKQVNGQWVVDKQHVTYFLDMNTWRKSGLSAPP